MVKFPLIVVPPAPSDVKLFTFVNTEGTVTAPPMVNHRFLLPAFQLGPTVNAVAVKCVSAPSVTAPS